MDRDRSIASGLVNLVFLAVSIQVVHHGTLKALIGQPLNETTKTIVAPQPPVST